MDSEGSSSSDEETENFANESSTAKKKKLRQGCIVPVKESESSSESELCDNRTVCERDVSYDRESGNSSDSSQLRWSRNGLVKSDLVIPESDCSSASSPVGSIPSDMSSIKGSTDTSAPSPTLLETNRNNTVRSNPVKITKRAMNRNVKLSDRYADYLPKARLPLQNRQVNRNILPRNVHSELPFRMNIRRAKNVQAPSNKASDHPSNKACDHPGASRLRIGLSNNVKTKQVLSAQSVLTQNSVACELQLPSQKQGTFIIIISPSLLLLYLNICVSHLFFKVMKRFLSMNLHKEKKIQVPLH